MIQLRDFRKITHKIEILIDEEVKPGEEPRKITFYWLPSALTARTYPNFVAMEDESVALRQQLLMEEMLERQAVLDALEHGHPSANPEVTTHEALSAEIKARRDKIAATGSMKNYYIASRLLLLLDPDKPCDIWDGVKPLAAEPEVFVQVFSIPFMERLTERIISEMFDPFDIRGRTGDTSSGVKPLELSM